VLVPGPGPEGVEHLFCGLLPFYSSSTFACIATGFEVGCSRCCQHTLSCGELTSADGRAAATAAVVHGGRVQSVLGDLVPTHWTLNDRANIYKLFDLALRGSQRLQTLTLVPVTTHQASLSGIARVGCSAWLRRTVSNYRLGLLCTILDSTHCC
jgi:hypothetical protein